MYGYNLDEYTKLIEAEKPCHTIEIVEKSTGKTGVANSYGENVFVFYGNDDGSDDKIITPEEFNKNFEITDTIGG